MLLARPLAATEGKKKGGSGVPRHKMDGERGVRTCVGRWMKSEVAADRWRRAAEEKSGAWQAGRREGQPRLERGGALAR